MVSLSDKLTIKDSIVNNNVYDEFFDYYNSIVGKYSFSINLVKNFNKECFAEDLTYLEYKAKAIETLNDSNEGMCTLFSILLNKKMDELRINNWLSIICNLGYTSKNMERTPHCINIYEKNSNLCVADVTDDVRGNTRARNKNEEINTRFSCIPLENYEGFYTGALKEYTREDIRVFRLDEPNRKIKDFESIPLDLFILNYGIQRDIRNMGVKYGKICV